MVIIGNILRHFKLNKIFYKFARTYHIQDRYLEYFRNKNDYKKSLIQFNYDYRGENAVFSEISFSDKEKGFQADEFFSHISERENVMKLSKSQLKDAISLMANEKIDSQKYEDALQYMDEKCAQSVDRWPLDFSLSVLDAWFSILGTKTFRKHYYCALTNLLNKKLKKCSKPNLILVLHFIGLSKRSPPFLMELLKYKMEKFILDFSDEEVAVACLSFFKTSSKINSDLLLQHCCKAAENLMLKNDRFNLISILKCLRLSEYLDNNLMTMLTDYVKKEYTTFNFVECTNFLATYATQNLYDSEIFESLEKQGISELSKEDPVEEYNKSIEIMHPSQRSRVKDLARYLWGLSFVGHNINKKSIDFIVQTLNARFNSGELESHLPVLIDCLQSLILCGHYPINLIEYVLKPKSLQKISNSHKAKPKYQLYFIDRSAYIENCIGEIQNKKFLNNIPKSLQKETEARKGFQDLINYLDLNLKENDFTCCYIMPHIMISGIVISTNPEGNNSDKWITSKLFNLIENGVISKSIQAILREDKMYTCIELLDSSVCVQGSIMPLGLMQTKIRQLQKLNFNVVTLSSDEISSVTNSKEGNCSKLNNLIR